MKQEHAKWIAARLLAAFIASFAFSAAVRAGSSDNREAHGNPAGGYFPDAISHDGSQQLSKGNAAYARGDYVEAFRLYRNIAVLGIAEAHYRLGLMYIDGLGTRKSVRQAEYWLKLATAEKHPGAAEALASLKAMAAQG